VSLAKLILRICIISAEKSGISLRTGPEGAVRRPVDLDRQSLVFGQRFAPSYISRISLTWASFLLSLFPPDFELSHLL
jgi:hypothetical protein